MADAQQRVCEDDPRRGVEIGIKNGPEDSFIQQIAKVDPATMKKVALSVTYRHEGVEPGEKGHERGKVQGRFAKGGKDTGSWIDLGNLSGTSEDWITVNREVTVPADMDGLMLRLGFYGTKAGKLIVKEVVATPITDEDLAAERAKYRPAEAYGPAVSDEKFARIMRGININGWFCQPWNQSVAGKKGGFNAEFFQAYVTADDIAMIKQMGFDHIRLPVDPLFLIDKNDGALVSELLPELDRAIAIIRAEGLAVIVDIHPKNNDFKGLSGKPVLREGFVRWWGEFAAHMAKTTDPEWVFLELLNEPGGQKYWANQQWSDYQDRLITAVRASAPDHTIIACGGAYMLVKELGKVTPHPDRNVVWAVHYYEPSPFTHQGAVWMKDWYHPLRDVPWPLTAENLDGAITSIAKDEASEKAAEVLRDQVKGNYATRAHMDEQFAIIAEWSKANQRRVHIGEYGVVDTAPRESRLRYLRAINEAFGNYGLGRSMWNYSGSRFTLMAGKDEPGHRTMTRRWWRPWA
ncbi:MAG: glycoside hydrolase family 5 protein [Blastochloris sp.]|nr:glycoside hydrolase family 5 protein [Blastochloris sp.]